MQDKSDSQSPPVTLQRIATAFWFVGWISLWVQLVLGVVSLLILLFASFSRTIGPQEVSSAGAGLGIVFAVSGVVTLGIGVYLAFRYTRLGKRLRAGNANMRPRKVEAIQILRLGLIVNLIGMLLTIIGAQEIAGTLILRSLSLPQGFGAAFYNPNAIIRPVDVFIVQANTNTIAAHFVGLIASLFLLNRVGRH